MAKASSEAPRERVNIVYKADDKGMTPERELPLRLLLVGDYTLRQDDRTLEDRKPIDITKDNFNKVLEGMQLNLSLGVKNVLSGKEDEEIPVKLKLETMKDFEPESIVNQVPELKALLQLRQALVALKGPLGNVPEFRKKIQMMVSEPAARDRIQKELGLKEGS